MLIARYEKLIFESPGEEVPLARLAELIRKRDGNLDGLLSSLEQKASEATDKYAPLIAWGGILAKDGQPDAAMTQLERATRLKPDRPEAWELLGQIQKSQGKPAEAKKSFEKALPSVQGPERSLLIRTLRDLSLDAGDYDAAQAYHRKLTNEARGNLFLQGELGRELLRRGQTARAVEELKRVVESSHGDARARAPALRDLGEAQLEAGQTKEAIKSLETASRLSVGSPGLRSAIDNLRADAHRKDGSLPKFLEELAASSSSASRLGLLGRLYEEEGNTEGAVATYEKALRRDASQIDLRLRLVRLYEVTGNIEGAVSEYGKLVKSSPRDVQLSLRYAEMLLAQGERARAVAELDRIDRLTVSDPEAGLMLLDFAERLEEKGRSRRILARLSASTAQDARFLVELGSRYYQNGETEKARRTWKRIVDIGSDKARGYLTYGEVLIDHEAATDGVQALRKANELAPDDVRAKKALALGLERAAAQGESSTRSLFEREALTAWKDVLEASNESTDPSSLATRSLARRHIVRLWKRSGKLADEVAPLQRKLAQSPPDLDSGRLLAEAFIASRADQRAIEVLEVILRHAPGDRTSLLLLEAAHTRRGNHKEAIKILERLVEADPQRAREYYDRMARAAAAQNDRQKALDFAELAVKKSPTDPAAQASLGDLYASQGRLKEAEAAYRRALSQDDRMHAVSLKLADILAKTNRSQEALEVLFHVTRSSRNLEAVGVAARRAISISVPMGEAREVEDVLRPLAIGHPQTPLYRSLLLEVLSSQMYPLLLASKHGERQNRSKAREELRALADRSTGPLLLALSGDDAAKQQVAISLLAHGGTPSASSGLLAFAEGSGSEEQRLLAILALGNHKTPDLAERLGALVTNEGTTRRGRIAKASAWALSRSVGARGLSTLLVALREGDPELRAYAALGIGDLDSLPGHSRSEATALLRSTLSGVQHGAAARSAAALALGRIAARDGLTPEQKQANIEAFLDASGSPSTLLQQSALVALAQTRATVEVRRQVAAGLLSPDTRVRAAATHAALLVASPSKKKAPALLPSELIAAEMDARSRVEDALTFSLETSTPGDRHEALIALETEIVSAAQVALRSSASTAEGVLEQLRVEGEHVLFGTLLVSSDLRNEEKSTALALATAERIRLSLQEEIAALATGPDLGLAERALGALRPDDSERSARILSERLRHETSGVHQAALRAITASPTKPALSILEGYLESKPNWGRRRRVAAALYSLAAPEGGAKPVLEPEAARLVEKLLEELRRDENQLVSAAASHESSK